MPDRVRAFFQAARPEGVVAAYLFGSDAEGRAHRESDVDVAVLLDRAVHPGARARFEVRVELTSALIAATGRNEVDVVVLNDVSPELGRRAVTTGIGVFCTDPEADHVFVRDVQILAADLDPFLRRVRRIRLESLMR
jgi:uncharacterized protein